MTIDIIGSFLPTEKLSTARDRFAAGAISRDDLTAIEDETITEVINRQLALGLKEITSGELRRSYWDKDFYFGLNGIGVENISAGRIYQNIETGTDVMRFNGRIAYNANHPFFDDFAYLHANVGNRAICRQTIPSPANLLIEIFNLSDGHPERIYPEPQNLINDIANAYNQTIAHFYSLGCRSLQLDDTSCGLLCDDNYTKELLQGGIDLVAVHNEIISLINKSIENLPSDMEISMYITAGDTIEPKWLAHNFADNIMPKILSQCNVSKFFLPFGNTDSQAELLQFVPAGKKVALGLVDAHTPCAFNVKKIINQINAATKYVPLQLLSVSPKTGFKLSSYTMRGLTFEDQWNKLKNLKDILAD